MVLILSTTRFPVSKAKEVGKRYLEVSKEFPLDKTLEKVILQLGTRIIGNEIEVISLVEVKEGKYEELLERNTKVRLRYADIEGINFIDATFLSGIKSLPMIGLKMPE